MTNGVLGQKEKELGLMVVNPVMIFLLDQTMPDQDVNGMENLTYLYFLKQAFDNFYLYLSNCRAIGMQGYSVVNQPEQYLLSNVGTTTPLCNR